MGFRGTQEYLSGFSSRDLWSVELLDCSRKRPTDLIGKIRADRTLLSQRFAGSISNFLISNVRIREKN